MSSNTKIEWCDSSWSPVSGCTPISDGCKNCYAARMAGRLAGRYGYPKDDPFRVTMHHDRLHIPEDWKKSKRIFVCSMGDIFHENVEWNWIFSIFQIAASLKRHKFLFLTKRPHKAYEFLAEDGGVHLQRQGLGSWPFENISIGVTIESQEAADIRIPLLLNIPAAVRFVSVEPMLEAINLDKTCGPLWCWRGNLDWVICGAETGPKARHMDIGWAISLKNQCKDAGIPFFFKRASRGDVAPDELNIREFPK